MFKPSSNQSCGQSCSTNKYSSPISACDDVGKIPIGGTGRIGGLCGGGAPIGGRGGRTGGRGGDTGGRGGRTGGRGGDTGGRTPIGGIGRIGGRGRGGTGLTEGCTIIGGTGLIGLIGAKCASIDICPRMTNAIASRVSIVTLPVVKFVNVQ